MSLLSDGEMIKAIREYRIILDLNGHKPTARDSRYAVAQAQFAKDQEEYEKRIELAPPEER